MIVFILRTYKFALALEMNINKTPLGFDISVKNVSYFENASERALKGLLKR